MISSTARQPNPATMKPAAATAWHCLTQRERDVLQAFFQLADDVRVAQSLGLARQTVTNHMNHIQRKLSVVSRAGLMKFIYEHRVNDSFGLNNRIKRGRQCWTRQGKLGTVASEMTAGASRVMIITWETIEIEADEVLPSDEWASTISLISRRRRAGCGALIALMYLVVGEGLLRPRNGAANNGNGRSRRRSRPFTA